jgi:hypothetical protein
VLLDGGIPSDPTKRLDFLNAHIYGPEKAAVATFDAVTSNIAQKITGSSEVPWFRVTVYLTGAYCFCTCCVLFHRPDFYNVKN